MERVGSAVARNGELILARHVSGRIDIEVHIGEPGQRNSEGEAGNHLGTLWAGAFRTQHNGATGGNHVRSNIITGIDEDVRRVDRKAIRAADRRIWVLAGYVVKGVNVEEDVADTGDRESVRTRVEYYRCSFCLVCLAGKAVRARVVPRVDRNSVDSGEQERVRASDENAGRHGVTCGIDAEVVVSDTGYGDCVVVHAGDGDHTGHARGRGKQITDIVIARIAARIDRDLYIVEGKTIRTADRCGRVLARYVRDGVNIESDVPNTLQSDGVVVHTGHNDDFTSRTRRKRE